MYIGNKYKRVVVIGSIISEISAVTCITSEHLNEMLHIGNYRISLITALGYYFIMPKIQMYCT